MSPPHRLLLDCKDVSYKTVWMDFPDVGSAAKAVGSLSNWFPKAVGSLDYAIPFITVAPRDRLSLTLSGSLKIAECIVEAFRGPEDMPLSMETHMFQSIFTKYLDEKVLLSAVFPLILTAFIVVMHPHMHAWFNETRKDTLGKTLEAIVPQGEGNIAQAWKNFEAAFSRLAEHIDKAGENCHMTGISCIESELIPAEHSQMAQFRGEMEEEALKL